MTSAWSGSETSPIPTSSDAVRYASIGACAQRLAIVLDLARLGVGRLEADAGVAGELNAQREGLAGRKRRDRKVLALGDHLCLHLAVAPWLDERRPDPVRRALPV